MVVFDIFLFIDLVCLIVCLMCIVFNVLNVVNDILLYGIMLMSVGDKSLYRFSTSRERTSEVRFVSGFLVVGLVVVNCVCNMFNGYVIVVVVVLVVVLV